jgi:molybdopterin-biosynthesis enzyme MoeA-like protein
MPTHDNVTVKSIANALDCEVVYHEEMANLLMDKMNTSVLMPAQIQEDYRIEQELNT